MDNIIDSYLIKLGAIADVASIGKFNQILNEVSHTVDSRMLSMASSIIEWQVKATAAFASVATAVVAMADKVADADQEYRLFGMTMYMNADAAKKLKITMDALGQPLGMLAWDKELAGRAERLESLQDSMEASLAGENFEANMMKVREFKFQITQLEVNFMYLKQAVINGLVNALGPQLDVWIQKLQDFNIWFSTHLPEIRDKINTYLIPILKAVWRVLKDTFELLGDLADIFATVINALSGDTAVDESISKWERFAKAVEHCATAVAWMLEKLIAVERFLMPAAATIGGALTGAKLGAMVGPEGVVPGAIIGGLTGLGIDAMRRITGGKASASTASSADSQAIAQQARLQAQRVSEMTGIAPDLIWAQWAHETNGFTNRGATSLNNLAGVNIPGGGGQDYRKFSSMDEFGDYYARLMRPGGRYSGIENAASPEEFAGRLKQGGYYTDTESNYAAGMQRWEGKYEGSGGSVDNSTSIGNVSINITQPNASPKEIQESVARGIAQHTDKQVRRNLNELSGVYA